MNDKRPFLAVYLAFTGDLVDGAQTVFVVTRLILPFDLLIGLLAVRALDLLLSYTEDVCVKTRINMLLDLLSCQLANMGDTW